MGDDASDCVECVYCSLSDFTRTRNEVSLYSDLLAGIAMAPELRVAYVGVGDRLLLCMYCSCTTRTDEASGVLSDLASWMLVKYL